MTTETFTAGIGRIRLPTKQELRAMFQHVSVVITAILCGTLLALAVLASVIYLAATNHDASVIGVLITGVIAAYGQVLTSRTRRLDEKIDQIKRGE